ncbi:MAG: hypothetical protein RJB39_38 [Candidatus Parcubacteria bacterium]|jgi:hypothetical protein
MDKPTNKGNGSTAFFFILILLIGFAIYQKDVKEGNDVQTPISTVPVTATTTIGVTTDKTTYKSVAQGFSFSYNSRAWTVHDKNGQIFLLKSKEFPNIESEIYALGEYIIIGKHPVTGNSFNLVQTLVSQENVYEGTPTKAVWETRANVPMLRIEHVNKDAPHTVHYYLFTMDGKSYYQIGFHPYAPGTAAYADFMEVVNSFVPDTAVFVPGMI